MNVFKRPKMNIKVLLKYGQLQKCMGHRIVEKTNYVSSHIIYYAGEIRTMVNRVKRQFIKRPRWCEKWYHMILATFATYELGCTTFRKLCLHPKWNLNL